MGQDNQAAAMVVDQGNPEPVVGDVAMGGDGAGTDAPGAPNVAAAPQPVGGGGGLPNSPTARPGPGARNRAWAIYAHGYYTSIPGHHLAIYSVEDWAADFNREYLHLRD